MSIITPAARHSVAAPFEPPATPAPPDRYAWQTPVPRTATATRRALAFAMDAVIVFLLAWLVTFAAATAGLLRIPDANLFGRPSAALGLLGVVSLFELPIGLAYFTLLERRAGQTPGKMLLGLRVHRVDGAPLTLFDSFLRNLLRLLWVTPLGPAFVLLDAWSLRATELDQRIGDLAVGTVVLDEREPAQGIL